MSETKRAEKKMVRVTIPTDMLDKLQRYADSFGAALSPIVIEAIFASRNREVPVVGKGKTEAVSLYLRDCDIRQLDERVKARGSNVSREVVGALQFYFGLVGHA